MGTKAKLAVSAEKSRGQFGAKTVVNGADVVRRQKVHRRKAMPRGSRHIERGDWVKTLLQSVVATMGEFTGSSRMPRVSKATSLRGRSTNSSMAHLTFTHRSWLFQVGS